MQFFFDLENMFVIIQEVNNSYVFTFFPFLMNKIFAIQNAMINTMVLLFVLYNSKQDTFTTKFYVFYVIVRQPHIHLIPKGYNYWTVVKGMYYVGYVTIT